MLIYKITNLINGKVYVGQTKRTLEERMSEHARKGKLPIDYAIKKCGIENFSVEEIDKAETQKELDEKEIKWVAFYDCIKPNGYNLTKGSKRTIGYKHTEEAKQKMSKSKLGIFAGDKNPFYGKHHSEEQKKKWSESRKGLKHVAPEKVVNIRKSHFKKTVMCIETGEIFDTIIKAAEKYNIKATHITRVCKGKRKSTGGYHWQYVDT